MKQPSAVRELMKAVVDLAQPRSQPGAQRLRAAERLGRRVALRSAGAGA